MQMLRALIAAPSVSSVSPQFDQSNRAVIELLAAWLEGKIPNDSLSAIKTHFLDFTKESNSRIGAFIKLFENVRFVRIKFARF